MSRRRLSTLTTGLVAGLVLLTAALAGGPASAAGDGILRLRVDAPVDGTTLVQVTRVDRAAPMRVVTLTDMTAATSELALAPGTYRISPRVLEAGGVRYVGSADPQQVRISSGGVATSRLTYVRSRGVQALKVAGLSPTQVELDWTAELGDDTVVRRRVGDEGARTPGQGTPVPLGVAGDSSRLLDEGLTPGTTYTYSIFARPGDGAFGRTDGDPVTLTVGTPSTTPTAGEASFVLNPRTRILSADDIASTATTGTGVVLTLAAGQPVPLPGDHLSLPVSPVLEGGYLGEVVSVGDDGATVLLRQGAMAAAFDLYSLSVPDFNAVEAAAAPSALAGTAPTGKTRQQRAKDARSRRGQAPDASTMSALAAPGPVASATPGGRTECTVQGGIDLDPSVDLAHAGHADVTISKYEIKWFPDIPNGVGWDLGYTSTLSGTIAMEVENAIECGLALGPYFKQLSVYPVPLGVQAKPEIGVSVSSTGSIENLGFTATAGFTLDGYVGLDGEDFVDGDLISSSTPTEPTGKGTFGVGLELGGSVAFGPGVGTNEAGVLIGVGGEVFLIDASVDVVQVVDESEQVSTCLEVAGATRMGVFLALRAWLPGYEFEERIDIDSLTGSFDWPGSPWHWPDDCTDGEAPTDDVVGDGVTPVEDELIGQSDQWGKVDGFVPGESTWVLSTGRVNDAVGDPGYFASTALGMPGDTTLTALSGFPTYDAASFRVTVIPNGETLNVRYAFASEEYPEYVGSRYNDVMAVLVDGENCAFVPGTQTPVAINTVNQFSHSEHYVDNTAGATGYGTTMDGLTKPLTCSVPVTPGEPVTVRIAVADSSDSAYDSAIALLDGGIWSE